MCGRYTLAPTDPSQLRARFPLGETIAIRPRYNVTPGDDVLAVVEGDAGPHGALLRWGLVPFWAQDPRSMSATMINARAETVAERPAYREAFERRRCLVVADGFYDWSGGVPHWIRPQDGEPFAFAGLWAAWRPRDAPADVEPLRSCAIVTAAAAPSIRDLHERMPVILPRAAEHAWLDPATPAAELHALLEPERAPAFEARAVGRAVNDARHDAPDCLDPPEQGALF